MNIRELDEESRRTGVWPPRRIILRVEREEGVADQPAEGTAPVKVGEVDLAAPPARAAAAPRPPAPSSSVIPARRALVPGARRVTPAPEPPNSDEDAAFAKWVEEPLAIADSDPEYQAPPVWLPEDRRVRAERRHRRIARKSRAQLFGASAATTLAVGGCAAAVALVGLSQTETIGGSLGVPSIGLFAPPPEPPRSNARADAANEKSAQRKAGRKPSRRNAAAGGNGGAAAPAQPPRRSDRTSARAPSERGGAPSGSARRSPASASRAPARVNPQPAPQRAAPPRAVRNPPPPPPVRQPPPAASRTQEPDVVWVAPSQPTAPSRPAPSPAPTTSSPAP